MCFHSCMYEEQFTNPAHYAYSGQFDQSQVIQNLKPSLRPRDCGPVDEVVTVTYADWPLPDWSCNNNQWIVMRQNRDGSDYFECASYMQYWWEWVSKHQQQIVWACFWEDAEKRCSNRIPSKLFFCFFSITVFFNIFFKPPGLWSW